MDDSSARRKNPRFTFGLKALFVLVGCFSLLVTLGSWLKRTHDQYSAADLFRRLGHPVAYDTRERESFLSGTVKPSLARYIGYNSLYSVVVLGMGDYSSATDEDLAHLRSLPKLEELLLRGPGITDAGLVHLRVLTHLETVTLLNTQVTTEGVAQLQEYLPDCRIEHWDDGDGR